jgi:hypothetical protein
VFPFLGGLSVGHAHKSTCACKLAVELATHYDRFTCNAIVPLMAKQTLSVIESVVLVCLLSKGPLGVSHVHSQTSCLCCVRD